jgi:hypothetical protein
MREVLLVVVAVCSYSDKNLSALAQAYSILRVTIVDGTLL